MENEKMKMTDNNGGREDGDRGREDEMKAERIMTEGEIDEHERRNDED